MSRDSAQHTEKNLKALRAVLEALGPAAHLAFVGDGPYRPELEAHFAGTQTTFTVGSLTKLLRRMLSAAIGSQACIVWSQASFACDY